MLNPRKPKGLKTSHPHMNAIKYILQPFFLIKNRFIRFVLVGCLNTAFGVVVYCLCIFIGMPYFIATLVSNVLGVLWNFKTTGRLVFENGDNRLIFRFTGCYIVIYLINTIAVKLLLLAGLNDYWAGILATPLVAICSYTLLKNFVYRERS